MIEYFRLKIEYLRSAFLRAVGSTLSPSCRLYEPEAGLEAEPEAGGSIRKRTILKMTEQSDIHKYSIVNIQ
jgi:hypothetical protein